jgi:signal transduction histidine kinase
VSLLIDLQLVRERWDGEPEPVDRALQNARAAIEDLRELAAGIHPAVLSQRGLDAALETLATRSPIPVELDVVLQGRLPAAVETAAYFVVAEALTNVVKYAEATHAQVAVRRDDGHALVEVRDDGVGGADAARGSGLRGLGDRVGALDGAIELESPRGHGTVVRARIPLGP